MGHGQGGNKGGSRRAAAPPRRSAPAANAGPTITEKIAARKAGGAESWDDFKAKLKEKQLAQHQTDNYDAVLAAQHRAVLDREREARLAAVRGVAAAPKPFSDKERKSEKEKRKKEKHKGKKHRKERHKDKRHKAEKHSGSKCERPDDASDDSSDDEATAEPSEPVRVGEVQAAGSSDDESDGSAADADAARGAGTAAAAGGGKAPPSAAAAAASTSASPAASATATATAASAAAPAASTAPPESRSDQPPHQVEAQLRRAALASMQLSFDVRREGAASFGLGCEPRGGLLVVREVERGSAAEAAGLQPGHTIVKLRDLHRKLPADAPGTEVVMSSASMRACVELIRLSQFCRFVVRQEGG